MLHLLPHVSDGIMWESGTPELHLVMGAGTPALGAVGRGKEHDPGGSSPCAGTPLSSLRSPSAAGPV